MTATVTNGRTEVDVDIPVQVLVTDAETAIDQLGYAWTATAGTIVGSGRTVTWRLPKGAPTPVDVTITVAVTEPYQVLENGMLVTRQHRVEGITSPFRVHDSPTEVRTVAMDFLEMFADAGVPPSVCVQNFSDSCPGKAAEESDIEDVRKGRSVQDADLTFRSVNLNGLRTEAEVSIACRLESLVTAKIDASDPFMPGDRVVADGICDMTAIYQQGLWKLCTSHFAGQEVKISGTSTTGRRTTIAGALRGY